MDQLIALNFNQVFLKIYNIKAPSNKYHLFSSKKQKINSKYVAKMSSLKLTSFTPLNSDTKKKVITIWKTLYDSNDSFQFRNPVDWKGMGLTDYPQVVKKPMDLNTISRKLRQQKYRTVENVLDDIQLIFDNCRSYNAPGSWIYNLAEKLQKSFLKMIRNFIPRIVQTNPKSKINPNPLLSKPQEHVNIVPVQQNEFIVQQISYNEKIKFSDKLTHISSQNLQAIMKKIIQKSPVALKLIKSQKQQSAVAQQNDNTLKQQNCIAQKQNISMAQGNVINQQNDKIHPQSELKGQNEALPIDKIQKMEIQQQNREQKNNVEQFKNQNSIKDLNLQIQGQQNKQAQDQLAKEKSQKKNQASSQINKPIQTQNMQIQESNHNPQKNQTPQKLSNKEKKTKSHKKKEKIEKQQKQTILQTKTVSLQEMQIGSKVQICVDDLSLDAFNQVMLMLEGMVEQKDMIMKKIKLD